MTRYRITEDGFGKFYVWTKGWLFWSVIREYPVNPYAYYSSGWPKEFRSFDEAKAWIDAAQEHERLSKIKHKKVPL